MSVSAKGKQQKKLVSTATVSGTVDRAYLILPFGDCRVHIFLTTFLEIAVYTLSDLGNSSNLIG